MPKKVTDPVALCHIAVRRSWPGRAIRASRELPDTRGQACPNRRWFGYVLSHSGAFAVRFMHYDGERAVPLRDLHNVASYAAGNRLLSRIANDLGTPVAPEELRIARATQVNGDFRMLMGLASAELVRTQVDCAVCETRDTLVYVAGLPMLRVTYALETGGYVAVQAFLTGISTPTVRVHFLSHRSAAAVFRAAPPTRIIGRLRGARYESLQEMQQAVRNPQPPVAAPSTCDDAVMHPDEVAPPVTHVRHRSVILDAVADAATTSPTSRVCWLPACEASLIRIDGVLAVYHYGDDFFWVHPIEHATGCVVMTKDGDAMATYPSLPTRDELGHDLTMAGCLHD